VSGINRAAAGKLVIAHGDPRGRETVTISQVADKAT
jgi:hypothetical protein